MYLLVFLIFYNIVITISIIQISINARRIIKHSIWWNKIPETDREYSRTATQNKKGTRILPRRTEIMYSSVQNGIWIDKRKAIRKEPTVCRIGNILEPNKWFIQTEPRVCSAILTTIPRQLCWTIPWLPKGENSYVSNTS